MRRFLLLAAAFAIAASAPSEPDWAERRDRMVEAVSSLAATSGARSGREIRPSVLNAMRRVPRHLFVPEAVRAEAYREEPLPIGHDATISSPYIVALMTDLLEARPRDRVLEVGTGSGYQAAILSLLAGQVFSIEIVEPLATEAAERLARLGFANVIVRSGDGYAGWPGEAPFDRIIVTAAAPHVPQPLLDQLRPGGRMVIPIGGSDGNHQLVLFVKDGRGRVSSRSILPVRFVPLVRR